MSLTNSVTKAHIFALEFFFRDLVRFNYIIYLATLFNLFIYNIIIPFQLIHLFASFFNLFLQYYLILTLSILIYLVKFMRMTTKKLKIIIKKHKTKIL